MRLPANVRDHQVEVAIGIEVLAGDPHPGDRDASAVVGATAIVGHVLEATVAHVVPEERRRGIVGNVEIDPAIAVEIRSRDAQAVAARRADAGALSHILKSAIAAVVVEPMHRWRCCLLYTSPSPRDS